MKVKILAGLVTAFIYGNAAWAQDVSDTNKTQQQSPDNMGGSGLADPNSSDIINLDQQDVAPPPDSSLQGEGVGGSGDQGLSGDQRLSGQGAFGGSGQMGQGSGQMQSGIPIQGQNGVTLFCVPQEQSTGGSGALQGGQSSIQRDYDVHVGSVDVDKDKSGFGGSGYEEHKEKEKGRHMRGLGVTIGGGVEGYTGDLAPNINPGPAAGVAVAIRPSSVLGLELAYSGAANNIDLRGGAGGASVGGTGPDIIRNGGQAALTLGLAATPVQPYLLGGVGVSRYNVRHGFSAGYRDDTVGNVPVGAGLRTQVGPFTADARVNYNFLFSEDFAPAGVDNNAGTGRYNGTLNIGGTF